MSDGRRRAAEAALVAKYFLLVLAVRIGLLMLPYRVLARWVPRTPRRWADLGKLRRTAWGVSRAAVWVPGATCLTQALTTQIVLARSGYASDIRIGVRRDAAGRFLAHAWLLSDDGVVIGGEHHDLAAFTVMTDLRTRAS